MKQLKLKIIENKKIGPGFYRIRVESVYLAKNTKPGQFFEVRCSGADEPLLRRPLGAHRILKNSVEMLYEVVGSGTKLISKKKAADTLDIIGPLGNGFTLPDKIKSATTLLVAGGVGVAPLFALAEKLSAGKLKVFIGACKKEHILCETEFKKLGAEVKISTEDGSKGYNGLVTDLLGKELSNKTAIYACGPAGMLKAVAKIAEGRQAPCQVSLEERMACGVGVCLGCPVKMKNGKYNMVCKDGPVFNAKEIAW